MAFLGQLSAGLTQPAARQLYLEHYISGDPSSAMQTGLKSHDIKQIIFTYPTFASERTF